MQKKTKLIPQTPTEQHLLDTYGVDCLLRYRKVMSQPPKITGSRRGSHKPWFSERPNLTPGMKATIKKQHAEGRSPASIGARWAIPTALVREILSA
jgi:hypothetical protein